ncbi:hypothetical protein Q5P01_005565 [Channa striata]|uniref:Uncharacterized protein n=1 Tax=Channa striata TaxID=64152 RepID=A0AA88NP53_CHASR|nr:hypothetical protein Q5P01_005565 [Channa striata]
MSVCWMFIILLGCWLSHATHFHTTCIFNERVDPICVTGQEAVHVPCPNITADEIRLNLQKDNKVIHNLTCQLENNTWKCPQSPKVKVKMQENKLFNFILYGLTEESQGIYRCDGTAMFPPPIKTVPSDVGILVLVEGSQCKCQKSTSEHKNPSLHGWIWIVLVVFLAIYSLTVTIIAFFVWAKQRKTDSQSDYMNTIPRAPRDRRRKRGVQIPIPRHF